MSKYFIRQVKLLAGGTALAQIINLISLPILTRIYSPSDFGIYALFISITSILGVFSTFKYENSIIAVDNDKEAYKSVYLIIKLSILSATIITCLFLLLSFTLNLNFQQHSSLILPCFFAIIFGAIYQALYYWNNRAQQYEIMTKGKVIASILVASFSISYGYFFNSFEGLLWGTVLGLLVNLIYLLVKGQSIVAGYLYPNNSILISHARELIRFPKFLIFSSFLDRLSSQLHIMMFTKYFGASVSGAIGIHNRVIGLPTTIIGNAVGDVFKRKASELLRDKGECIELLYKTSLGLLFIALPIAVILYLYAPVLFVLVLGEEWLQAGEFSQILAINFLFAFIVSPISTLIYLGNNQRFDLYIQMLLIIMLAIGMSYAVYTLNLMNALYAYSWSYIIKYSVEFLICVSIAKGNITVK